MPDLEQLYREYRSELTAYIVGRFGAGPPDPDDIVQAAFEKLATYDQAGSIGNFRAFLYTTIRHLIVDSKRRDRRNELFIDDALYRAGAEKLAQLTPERVLEEKDRFSVMSQAIAKLPEKQQITLRLNRIDGLTYDEISRRTGWSISDISRQVRAAVETLRRAVEHADDGK